VHHLPRQQVQHDSFISVGPLLKSPAKYNLFADYFQSHTQYELQDFAQPLHWYWKLWQSGDVTSGAAPPLPNLGALPAAAAAGGPRWTAGGPRGAAGGGLS
jgi:hypothetical protein